MQSDGVVTTSTSPRAAAGPPARAVPMAPTVATGPVDSVALVGNNTDAPAHPSQTALQFNDPQAELLKIVLQNMSHWPHQADGSMTPADLDRAVQDPHYHGEEAAALGVLVDNFDDLSKAHSGRCITLADIQQGDLGSSFQEGVNYLATASRELFNGPVDYRMLAQGGVGDCYFLGPLTNEARLHPDHVVGMAKDNGPSVTVTLPGRAPETVPKPTDAQLVAYAGGGTNGTWPTVFEAAWEASFHPGMSPSEEPGDEASTGIKAVTGHDSDTVLNHQVTVRQLDAMLDLVHQGKNVDCSTFDRDYTNGLHRDHVYSILDYDPKRQVLVIRNPWGSGIPLGAKDLGHGAFEYSLQDFIQNFEDLTVEK